MGCSDVRVMSYGGALVLHADITSLDLNPFLYCEMDWNPNLLYQRVWHASPKGVKGDMGVSGLHFVVFISRHRTNRHRGDRGWLGQGLVGTSPFYVWSILLKNLIFIHTIKDSVTHVSIKIYFATYLKFRC
jgi:hypothetical protein